MTTRCSPCFSAIRTVFVLLLVIASPMAATTEADGVDPSRYACWSLGDALDDLRTRGLGLVWSTDLVHPEMRIQTAPRADDGATSPTDVLHRILAPFGLTAEPSSVGDLLLVVPGGDRAAITHWRREEGLLPLWTDAQHMPAIWTVSDEATYDDPPKGTRFLIVRPAVDAATDDASWGRLAFALKNALVDVESRHPQLEIAVDGEPDAIRRLIDNGLAPYIHGYVHRGTPWRPAADASARTWRWFDRALTGSAVLDALLEAGAAGDRVAIFADTSIAPLHRAFLERLAVTPGAALDQQPAIRGIEAERVRFFLDPDRGDYVLAVHGDGSPHTLRFDLPNAIATESLFPESAAFEWIRATGGQSLDIDGRYPYYLFRLRVAAPSAPHVGVDVTDSRLIDPYEEVVKNQVFQDAEREKFRSLDVMEYLTSIPQWAGGDQITWEHRILHRVGRLTEYHHLGFTQNGVHYPEDKLLKGRLFRNEALVQLDPLEVELDETYRYSYLGEETIDGRLAYHIAFEPLRRSTREDGSFVRGEVWLDVETHAHLAVRTYQEGLDGQLIYQDRTRFYEWIPSNGQCFWDWRRREGTYVVSSLGQSYAVATETLRTDFEFNRPDIDQIAQEAYDSDIMIHVETPPEGHRWLVKRDGERRLAVGSADWDPYPAAASSRQASDRPLRVAGVPAAGDPEAGDPEAGAPVEAEATDTDSGRVLANIHSFSKRYNLSMGGFGSDGDEIDLFPGLVFSDNDFRGKGEQAFVGLFRDFGLASIAAPGLFNRGWIGSATLDIPWEADTSTSSTTIDGVPRSGTIEVHEPSLTLAMAIPAARRWSVDTRLSFRSLDFAATDATDPDFILPSDTTEVGFEVEVTHRRRMFSASLGLELGHRLDWKPWGFDRRSEVRGSYSVTRLGLSTFRRVGTFQTLGFDLTAFGSNQLDRFSRLPQGRARATVAGFGSGRGFDRGLFAGITYGTQVFKRFPVSLQLQASRQRIGNEAWEDRVGAGFRFQIHGPWRTDLWPSIRYGISSNVPGAEGDVVYGLVIRRRY